MREEKSSEGIDRIAAAALIPANTRRRPQAYLSPLETVLVGAIAEVVGSRAGGLTNI